jgi:hypothetical protein
MANIWGSSTIFQYIVIITRQLTFGVISSVLIFMESYKNEWIYAKYSKELILWAKPLKQNYAIRKLEENLSQTGSKARICSSYSTNPFSL